MRSYDYGHAQAEYAPLSSAQPTAIYSSQQRRAVPCLALRCGAYSCCAVLSFEHTSVLPFEHSAVPGM